MNPPIEQRGIYDLNDLRAWASATAGMNPPLRLAVCGDPVAHSASPPMHNAALAAAGINLRYTRLHLRAEELTSALPLLHPAGFVGVNVTLPHKTAVLPLLDAIDPLAADLGAVNTVRVEPDGSLRGFNTDGPGFARAVRETFGAELASLRVLVLGAGGGAGRALGIYCASAGSPLVLLANRTAAKAHALAAELNARLDSSASVAAIEWKPAALAGAAAEVDLIVNATSLGLHADSESPLSAEAIPARLLVFDTVYRSGAVTPLVQAAQQAGARATDGLPLLLHQGALSFEHWFGRPAPLEAMRSGLAGA